MDKYIPVYPSVDHPDIQRIITEKKEFYELSSDSKNEIDNPFGLHKYQILFGRLARITDRIILMYGTGMGKTYSFLNLAETYRRTSIYDRVIIFEQGNSIINDIEVQILNKFRGGVRHDRQTQRQLREWYNFNTYDSASRELEMMTDREIAGKYQNKIIIFDEAHKLIPMKDKIDRSKRYQQFLRLCQHCVRCKIVFSTATPIVNYPNELGYLINLIRPERPIPLKDYYSLRELEPYLRGRVSYIQSRQSDLKIDYPGERFEFTELYGERLTVGINMHLTRMGDLQEEVYRSAPVDTLYQKQKNYSSFVFPTIDGVQTTSSHYLEEKGGVLVWKNYPNFQRWEHRGEYASFPNWLSDINNLRRVSGKMADIIETETREDGCSFVYHEIVLEAGVKLLTLIFTLYGFEPFVVSKSDEVFNEDGVTIKSSFPKRKRVALITSGSYGSTGRQSMITNLFNSPENIDGEYIKTMIISEKAKEGINIYHCRRIHLFEPLWNMAGMTQAISRGLRVEGHNAIRERLRNEAAERGLVPGTPEYNEYIRPQVSIYRHCIDYNLDRNISGRDNDNSDYQFMRKAMLKEIPNNRILEYLKVIAVDNIIHRNDNRLVLNDPFNFEGKEYIPSWTELKDPDYTIGPLDYSTYSLYNKPSQLYNRIKGDLVRCKHLRYRDIFSRYSGYTRNEIYQALEMIQKDRLILDEYDYHYAAQFNPNGINIQRYSVTANPDYITDLSYYDNPTVIVVRRSVSDYMEEMRRYYSHAVYGRFYTSESPLRILEQYNSYMIVLTFERLVVNYIQALPSTVNKNNLRLLLNLFSGYYVYLEDRRTYVHSIYTYNHESAHNIDKRHVSPTLFKIYPENERLEYFRPPTELELPEIESLYRSKIKTQLDQVVNKTDVIRGTVLQDGILRIFPVSASDDTEDKRMKPRGTELSSIPRRELIEIAVSEEIPPPTDSRYTDEQTISQLKVYKTESQLESITPDQLKTYAGWMPVNNIASYIRDPLKERLNSSGRLYAPYQFYIRRS